MNVEKALEFAKNSINTDTSQIDSEVILAFVLDKNRTWLKTWPDYDLAASEQKQFEDLINRRAKGEPVAYITGQRDFWTLDLKTNSSTLIPRPETEQLVELSLSFLEAKSAAEVLDLGTGTGAIALAIASERKKDFVLGADFNPQAIELAESNAKRNQITNAEFIHSNWFEKISDRKFDLIVSNPPYIATDDPHLNQGDVAFEPESALVAQDEGLADIKHISRQARSYLKAGGGIMFEHGFEQGEQVRAILAENGYSEVETVKDLAGLDRVSKGIFNAN